MKGKGNFPPNDPYKHAPPKPDGDPWAILLTPQLEADKMRCDSWKEEVQTLLIFAGLFSAVVTTFVIESYKFLQPNPNDAIISLLFHIANNLNDSSPLFPSDYPASIATSFVQTPSSVRINVFWFLSLILSLTTVLAGTIALQWLREHQSYTGYSAKETLAILNMRSEAIETWHVPQIFAGLPLLLQTALVLFLAGLVDFSLPLGLKLTIPISIIIGLTLLFLAATTAFPTFQALSFLTGLYSRDKIPSPCAFRSPQSYAFHSLFRILLRAFSFVFPRYSIFPEDPYSDKPTYKDQPADRQHLVPHLYVIWDQETYNFDLEWLSLRDACHQFIFDKDPCLFEHRQSWEKEFPLSDVTCCVVDVVKEGPSPKHTELFLIAAYYCFQEISSSIWNKQEFSEHTRIDRRDNYFQQLQENYSNSNSTATFLYHGDTTSGNDFLIWKNSTSNI
ncbi:hypothetical protein BJ912DRAFT_41003 [Pholiota molesta]|nr:hypothetical protein BJ912DRAFT_41003 [Pholiota molesta]